MSPAFSSTVAAMAEDDAADAAAQEDDYAADEAQFSCMEDPQPIPGIQASAQGRDDAAVLVQLWHKYFPDKEPGQISWAGIANISDAFRILEIQEDQPPEGDVINKKTRGLYIEAASVLSAMDRSGLRVREQMSEFMIRVIFAKIEAIQHMFIGLIKLSRAESMQPADFGPANRGMWRFMPEKPEEDMNPGQRMRMFALNDLAKQGYRRYREDIVQSVTVRMESGGIKNTCAWERIFSIHDYVKTLSGRRLTNPEVWMDLTSGQGISGMKSLEEYLVACDDPEVPEIVTDRTVFSFINGVYLAKQEIFVEYEHAERFFPPNQYPIACKHHRVPFDPEWTKTPDPMDIPTPAMDCIMNSQHWSPNVMRWAYALFGRLFYNVGEFDDWQVVPFLKGLAATGKSAILNFIREIYEDSDIGIISNTIEKQFGLSAVCDKFLAIADDIRKNMQLDQTEFQNSISGNGVSCAIKFKTPKLIKPWFCTQLWSGNEPPGFHDNSGSVGRRFATLLFAFSVTKPDGDLPDKLLGEMAAFICKANRCYKNMIRRYGSRGIWKILPREFGEQRAELTATTNALIGLLNSELVRKHKAGEQINRLLYMPVDELLKAVNAYAQSHNLEKPQWGPDYYRGPLTQAGLEIGTSPQRKNYPRHTPRRLRAIYVHGIDIEAVCELGEMNGGEVFAAAAASAAEFGQQPRKRARLGPLDADGDQ